MASSPDPESIEIVINGEARSVRRGTTVAALVDELGLGSGRVAVERNRSILPRGEWGIELAADDRLEVVAFVGGG